MNDRAYIQYIHMYMYVYAYMRTRTHTTEFIMKNLQLNSVQSRIRLWLYKTRSLDSMWVTQLTPPPLHLPIGSQLGFGLGKGAVLQYSSSFFSFENIWPSPCPRCECKASHAEYVSSLACLLATLALHLVTRKLYIFLSIWIYRNGLWCSGLYQMHCIYKMNSHTLLQNMFPRRRRRSRASRLGRMSLKRTNGHGNSLGRCLSVYESLLLNHDQVWSIIFDSNPFRTSNCWVYSKV